MTCEDCKAAMRADLAAAARSPAGNQAPLDSAPSQRVSLTGPPSPGAADKEQP